jgi:hypothetical protein
MLIYKTKSVTAVLAYTSVSGLFGDPYETII